MMLKTLSKIMFAKNIVDSKDKSLALFQRLHNFSWLLAIHKILIWNVPINSLPHKNYIVKYLPDVFQKQIFGRCAF